MTCALVALLTPEESLALPDYILKSLEYIHNVIYVDIYITSPKDCTAEVAANNQYSL